jgi:hypothetical protein
MLRIFIGVMLFSSACGSVEDAETDAGAIDVVSPDAVAFIPLTELGTGTYHGFEGGLYEGGENVPPVDFRPLLIARANLVEPLGTDGMPADDGKIVLLSIGFSNATQSWCSMTSETPCESWSFTGRALADDEVDRTHLAIVNGAKGGQNSDVWDDPTELNYDRVRDERLAPVGLTEAQVQVVWVKVAHGSPAVSLPALDADAHTLAVDVAEIARALAVRYPNLQLAFFSSRTYGGWAEVDLNPEPYAYEGGFAVKWAVQAQIAQATGGGIDATYGDLAIGTAAPAMAWGPYLWDPTWPRSFYEWDGTHVSAEGEAAVASRLLTFFKTSPVTKCWFLAADAACP